MQTIWNRALTFLAISFLVSFSYPAFAIDVSPTTNSYLEMIQWFVWAVFALELVIGFQKADNKKVYVKSHPLEIATVLLPFLRPLRLMRGISFAGLALEKIAMGRQLAISIKMAITTLFVAYIFAVQVTLIERPIPNSNIKNIGDGLWWAATTVTTVGYGDRYPVSTQGRVLAVLLMFMGISLLGVVTASIASWFVKIHDTK